MKIIFKNSDYLEIDIEEFRKVCNLLEDYDNNVEEFIIPEKFSKTVFIKYLSFNCANIKELNDDIYEITELSSFLNNTILFEKLCFEISNRLKKVNCGEKFLAFIEKYPNIKWDWDSISRNPNITMD